MPLIADESCITEGDVERCAGLFDGINIKLVKCGGLAAARRMITRARELGLAVMAGCMTESTVGISSMAPNRIRHAFGREEGAFPKVGRKVRSNEQNSGRSAVW